MKLLKFLILLILILFLVVNSPHILANPDSQVDLRLYKGSFPQKSMDKVSVTTDYYLKPMFSGTIILDSNLKEEKEEIKKVFNLLDLKLITQAKWGWKQGRKTKKFQVITLDNREFLLQFFQLDKNDNFKLEVIEKTKEKAKKLLEVEIILPQERTSIFGFENSAGRPYFISFQRGKDREITGKESLMVASIKRPRLIKKVQPKYPKEALKKNISGKVILECTMDIYGRVKKLEVTEGHPLLSQAAKEAVKQWVYEPYILNEEPQGVKFTVLIKFNLAGKKKSKSDQSLKKISKKNAKFTREQLINNLKNNTFSGEPMDLEFENADLKNVIHFLSKISNLKMTLDKGITGKVTCKFNQIPWDKALASFLQENRLELVLENNQFKIRKLKK
ncbi:MAG: TonB family protein [Candidatus Aminicenantes bacterium]|nr:TonB family protein [Candidatus Aminicenantes bacterium]